MEESKVQTNLIDRKYLRGVYKGIYRPYIAKLPALGKVSFTGIKYICLTLTFLIIVPGLSMAEGFRIKPVYSFTAPSGTNTIGSINNLGSIDNKTFKVFDYSTDGRTYGDLLKYPTYSLPYDFFNFFNSSETDWTATGSCDSINTWTCVDEYFGFDDGNASFIRPFQINQINEVAYKFTSPPLPPVESALPGSEIFGYTLLITAQSDTGDWSIPSFLEFVMLVGSNNATEGCDILTDLVPTTVTPYYNQAYKYYWHTDFSPYNNPHFPFNSSWFEGDDYVETNQCQDNENLWVYFYCEELITNDCSNTLHITSLNLGIINIYNAWRQDSVYLFDSRNYEPIKLDWNCVNSTGSYHLAIINKTTVKYPTVVNLETGDEFLYGEFCPAQGNYYTNITQSDLLANEKLRIGITDWLNETSPNCSCLYQNYTLDKFTLLVTQTIFVSSENLQWLVYAVIVGGTLFAASFMYYIWKKRRDGN
jgi:hypothetical protein